MTPGALVYVARNLHKDQWSLRIGGKVAGYADTLRLENVMFKVSESGRQRVIREKKKNVHAYVVGSLVQIQGCNIPGTGWTRISYNPYKAGFFYDVETGKEVKKASQVIFGERYVWAIL